MHHLSPQTLTTAEQRALLQASSGPPRDHLIFSLALGFVSLYESGLGEAVSSQFNTYLQLLFGAGR